MLINSSINKNDSLGFKMKMLSEEVGIDYYDLLSIAVIFCKSINQLKEESNNYNLNYKAVQLSHNKWIVVNTKTVSIIRSFDDELTAYRAARVYEVLNNKRKINAFNEKLYEI